MLTTENDVVASEKGKVFIDWTDVFTDVRTPEASGIDGFLAWVKQYPKRSDIHVRIRARRLHDASRRLQRNLQALGCTVIAQSF